MSNVTQFSADFTQLTLSKKTKIVLEIPEGTSFAKLAEIAQHRGERIIVQFGNPQMEMNFRSEGGRPGLVATINGRGEVESVERSEEDGEQGDLFPQDGEETDDTDLEGEDFEFEETEGEPDSEDLLPEDDEEVAEIDREELEEYILREQPEFPDIPFNFSELLRRRREEEVTWMDLAKEVGVSSTKLQIAYQVFKKRVVRMMKEAGVA
jgi:hypothetical protein